MTVLLGELGSSAFSSHLDACELNGLGVVQWTFAWDHS